MKTEKTDRWGEPISYPDEMLRTEPDGTYSVRVRKEPGTVWCRGHGCLCQGYRTYPDPEGSEWAAVESAFGCFVTH